MKRQAIAVILSQSSLLAGCHQRDKVDDMPAANASQPAQGPAVAEAAERPAE
jgi:outer membrane murein-binding lipoprotein Lpp